MSLKTPTTRQPLREKKSETTGGGGFGSKTILFNDNFHTFHEVANQLVRAIRCSFSEGLAIASVVHTAGSAVVYRGHMERCEAVAMVLEEIGLKAVVDK